MLEMTLGLHWLANEMDMPSEYDVAAKRLMSFLDCINRTCVLKQGNVFCVFLVMFSSYA